MTIENHFVETLKAHESDTKEKEMRRRSLDALGAMGIPPTRFKQYPHEFSGGMRQRIMIALALVLNPKVLVADEPTTALDVIVEGQILEILADLRRNFDTALLLITHNLGIVAEACDRVAVMYAGRIVESGPVATLLDRPRHPYTRGLLRSRPSLAAPPSADGRLPSIPGQVPDPRHRPPGCAFHPRCPLAEPRCRTDVPPLVPVAPSAGRVHLLACPVSREDDGA
jgi:oligopeptide/dipeptide ABC transporter ATP-binding protein